MNTFKIKISILTAIMFISLINISSTIADGFRNPPESASALGRIGGKIVHTEDASAATINPANITKIKNPSVMVSLTAGYGSKEFTSAIDGSTTDTKDNTAYLPSIYATIPAGDVYTFGLGVTFPFGRHSEWDKSAIFSTTSPYYSELIVANINPSIARKFGDNVSVGIGVSLYQSSLQFKQVMPWSVLTKTPASPSGTGNFEGDGTSFGINFGITWDIAEHHSVALTYRSPFDVTYKGDFDVTETPAGVATMGITSHSDFETKFKFPTMVALGYGMEVTDRLRVEFNIEWIEASRNKEFVVDIENNNILVGGTPAPSTIPQNWDDNWTFGIGADYQCTESIIARAGYMYLDAPSPTSTMIPVASEENQSVISFGLGYTHEVHTFDIAYAYGILNGITVDDNANPAVNGSYDHESHLLSAAYGYQF
jgi:long-chain fatty acid transport protein